jgi:hypothetical protein
MTLVYFAFGLSLIYFLFFTSGLSIVPDPLTPTSRVLVVNDSVHAIRDVTLYYVWDDKLVKAGTVPLLHPGEEKPVLVDTSFARGGKVVLQASAPFHVDYRLVLLVQNPDDSPPLSFSFSLPDIGFVGEPVEVLVEICNSDALGVTLRPELEFSDDSLIGSQETGEFVAKGGSCKEKILTFVPLMESQDLSFNIRVFRDEQVVAVQDHKMQILMLSNDEESGT